MDEERWAVSNVRLVNKEMRVKALTHKNNNKNDPLRVNTKQPAELVYVEADVLKNPSNSQTSSFNT